MTECDHADVRAVANPRYMLRCEACGAEVFEDLAFGGYTSTWGWACEERERGRFFIVANEEYETQVNSCPFCGARAPVRAELATLL